MMSMNSDKTYKWDKMKYEIMNIKVEVNMMKAVIYSICSKEVFNPKKQFVGIWAHFCYNWKNWDAFAETFSTYEDVSMSNLNNEQ